jgi:uracil phosphoribosyltransferase
VTRDLELELIPIETPMGPMNAPTIKGKKLVLLRFCGPATGCLDGMLDLVPAARVAHIGIYRDHETLQPVEYYFKAPSNLEDRLIIVVDPMLATANSHCRHHRLSARHQQPAVPLPLAAPGLRKFLPPSRCAYFHRRDRQPPQRKGYIVPGLGDAGDRMAWHK